jgi:hypothetical protein
MGKVTVDQILAEAKTLSRDEQQVRDTLDTWLRSEGLEEQLAAAVEVHTRGDSLGLPVLTLVFADEDLNVAATAEGLAVANPNRH